MPPCQRPAPVTSQAAQHGQSFSLVVSSLEGRDRGQSNSTLFVQPFASCNISSFPRPVSPLPHQRDSTQSPTNPVTPLQDGRAMGRRCPPAVTVPSGRWLPGVRWFCSRQGGAWWGRQPWQGQRIAVPTRWLPQDRGARLPTWRTRWPRWPRWQAGWGLGGRNLAPWGA